MKVCVVTYYDTVRPVISWTWSDVGIFSVLMYSLCISVIFVRRVALGYRLRTTLSPCSSRSRFGFYRAAWNADAV